MSMSPLRRRWVCACPLLLLAARALAEAAEAPVPIVKLGLYDYFTDESSPVIFNGQLLMFESIVQASPQWAGHWLPDFANCSCYYRIREVSTGAVIVNISQTCNHAFGAAFVIHADPNATSSSEGSSNSHSRHGGSVNTKGSSGNFGASHAEGSFNKHSSSSHRNSSSDKHSSASSWSSNSSWSNSGGDTLWIFGTPWIRPQASQPSAHSPVSPPSSMSANASAPYTRALRRRRPHLHSGWTPLCNASTGICAVDAFWSADPFLVEWTAVPGAAPLPKGAPYVYNNDVTHVPQPSSPLAAARRAASGLPPFDWIMAIETTIEFTAFMLSNASSPGEGWALSLYRVPSFPGTNVGPCPSIRYDASTGYFYVLTGGDSIYAVRSTDLVHWTLASGTGALIAPSTGDCQLAAPPYGGWYSPSPPAQGYIQACKGNSAGFGDDSDVDLVEVTQANGTVATLFQYGAGNQATFGFANLAIAQAPMFDVLSSYFAASDDSVAGVAAAAETGAGSGGGDSGDNAIGKLRGA